MVDSTYVVEQSAADQEPDKTSKESHILSCERCARRKIKCDRCGDGCLNCKKAGVACHVVARPRLPRGRRAHTGKATSDLKARLLRLEGLVSSYAQQGDGSDSAQSSGSPPPRVASPSDSLVSAPSRGVNKYVGSQFWSDLSQEITEVREALDSSEDEEDIRRESLFQVNGHTASSSPNSILFGSVSKEAQAVINFSTPDVQMARALCEIYLYRFSAVMKISHGPSIRALMCGQQYLDYPMDHTVSKLLYFAVCYSAVETLTETECSKQFLLSKTVLKQRFQTATELYLAKADLLTTSDLSVLEAFMIYIVALRASDVSRKAWTLMATAVRLAQAMGLPQDDSQLHLKPFCREMRRRTWLAVRIFDTRCAFDRGTTAMAAPGSLPLPLNINDADFCFESEGPLHAREGYTDVTHSLVIIAGIDRHNTSGHWSSSLYGNDPTSTQAQHIAWYRDLEHKYLRHIDTRVNLQWFTRQVASTMAATSLLFAARPMRLGEKSTAGTLSSDTILLLAVDVLEKATSVKTDARGLAWDWFTFVPWHSLAVAIAELCVRPSGPVVDKAWPVIESAFAQYSSRVADSDQGLLWRPLRKLLNKAHKTRNFGVGKLGPASAPISNSTTPPQVLAPQDTFVLGNGYGGNQLVPTVDFQTSLPFTNNPSNAPQAGDADWFQSVIDQHPTLMDTDINGSDQWDSFISNMGILGNDEIANYNTDPFLWNSVDVQQTFPNGPSSDQQPNLWTDQAMPTS